MGINETIISCVDSQWLWHFFRTAAWRVRWGFGWSQSEGQLCFNISNAIKPGGLDQRQFLLLSATELTGQPRSHGIWIVFKQVQAKTHQPLSWLDGPEDEGQRLVHGAVAKYFLLCRVVFGCFAGDVAVQDGFLWEPEDGELRSLSWKAVQQVPVEKDRESRGSIREYGLRMNPFLSFVSQIYLMVSLACCFSLNTHLNPQHALSWSAFKSQIQQTILYVITVLLISRAVILDAGLWRGRSAQCQELIIHPLLMLSDIHTSLWQVTRQQNKGISLLWSRIKWMNLDSIYSI